jgi:trehalose-phosphatase
MDSMTFGSIGGGSDDLHVGMSLAGLGLEDRIKISQSTSGGNLSQASLSSHISNPQSAKGKGPGTEKGKGGEKSDSKQGGAGHPGEGAEGGSGLSFKDIWAQILADVIPLLEKYVWHTAGAEVVHLHQFSVAWKYTHADPEWGDMQAKRLSKELRAIYGDSHHVKVTLKKGFVELHPKTLDKGRAVNAAVEQLTNHWRNVIDVCEDNGGGGEDGRGDFKIDLSGGKAEPTSATASATNAEYGGCDYDFVLCVGDDMTDEPMFQIMTRYHKQWQAQHAGSTGSPMGESSGSGKVHPPLNLYITHTPTRTPANPHSHTHTRQPTLPHAHPPTHTPTRTPAHSHSHQPAHTPAHTPTSTPAHPPSHQHAHTPAHPHAHPPTHSQAHLFSPRVI